MEVRGRKVMETQSERPDESKRPDKTTVKTPARAAERKKTLVSALGALGFSKAEARERAREVLERVGLKLACRLTARLANSRSPVQTGLIPWIPQCFAGSAPSAPAQASPSFG